MAGIPRVALLIETAREYGRGVLRGVVRYARTHGPWAFYITPGDFKQVVPRIEQWGGTGIIARIETPEIAEALLATRLPLVALDLSAEQLGPASRLRRCAELASDSWRAAQLAAEHLLERGFRHYAFVGIAGRIWSKRREQGFCERLRAADLPAHVYPAPQRLREREWAREQSLLADWLRCLPKPIGVMACNDDRGREVLAACRAAGLAVPEEVAVVGVDNDELLCELADPPLSSVALNAERGGYEAAALLDNMMCGRIRKPRQILTEALHVVARRSTDMVALGDREVAEAMRFIYEHAGRPIRVREVVDEVAISRRALEMRFQRATGRSIHDEIRRAHLERAKRLLIETDLPIPDLAEACGHATASYFVQVFSRQLGMTPARYRRDARGE